MSCSFSLLQNDLEKLSSTPITNFIAGSNLVSTSGANADVKKKVSKANNKNMGNDETTNLWQDGNLVIYKWAACLIYLRVYKTK